MMALVTFNPDENIFYIDVTNIPPEDVASVIQGYREQFEDMTFRTLTLLPDEPKVGPEDNRTTEERIEGYHRKLDLE